MVFLRVFVGVMGVFFGHYFGQSVVRLRRGQEVRSRTIGWGLRTAVTVGAVLYTGRRLDAISIAVLALAAAAAAYGAWRVRRPARQEDLSQDLFPKE